MSDDEPPRDADSPVPLDDAPDPVPHQLTNDPFFSSSRTAGKKRLLEIPESSHRSTSRRRPAGLARDRSPLAHKSTGNHFAALGIDGADEGADEDMEPLVYVA
jgi:hypothetical protein